MAVKILLKLCNYLNMNLFDNSANQMIKVDKEREQKLNRHVIKI